MIQRTLAAAAGLVLATGPAMAHPGHDAPASHVHMGGEFWIVSEPLLGALALLAIGGLVYGARARMARERSRRRDR